MQLLKGVTFGTGASVLKYLHEHAVKGGPIACSTFGGGCSVVNTRTLVAAVSSAASGQNDQNRQKRGVSRYLEVSLAILTRDEEKFRQQIAQAFGSPFGALEDQARLNMELFERAFAMLSPFARRETRSEAGKAQPSGGTTTGGAGKQEIDELRRHIQEMQQRIDQLSEKDKSGRAF